MLMNLHEHKFLHIQIIEHVFLKKKIIEHVYQILTSEDYLAK